MMTRREFMVLTAAAGCSAFWDGASHAEDKSKPVHAARLLFTSQGKTAIVNADGTGLRDFEFDVPNQATWQPAGFFPDGRALFLSMEPRRDGPGKPFAEYYTQTPTHLWAYDLETHKLTELATRDRLAVFYTPQLILNDERILVQVARGGSAQIFSMNLDGSDAREFTRPGEGFPYGLSLSPDGKTVAFHLATPAGYQIWTAPSDGSRRTQIAARPGHLYFGPVWSPDGQWLAFEDCLFQQDPGHDWCDVVVCRADGSELRQLTDGQAMWFGATYGPPENRGGGSNLLAWSAEGALLFPRRLPGSKVPWEFQPSRPDTDHFNRDFKPELARGGTEICRLDPTTKKIMPLTHSDPPVWDFRATPSPDGRLIAWCRAATGGVPALWLMNADGSQPRELTKGHDNRGLDHPRWAPATAL